MSIDNGVELINNFINNDEFLKDAKEPFPISLRTINWVKFLSFNTINDPNINNSLYRYYIILLDNLEYHLLGNHLLENGFSLLFGAYYFNDEKLYLKAKKILKYELDEQILNDGAHFELTPMYHQIILFRILDCINLVQNNNFKNQDLLELLKNKASIMLGWLKNITYINGNIPLLNDSTNKIAPTSKELFDYAKRLKVKIENKELKESGYRKITNDNYECVIDIGNIGPDYIPGHAHSDTFNFELQVKSKAFIVDTGLSTYETSNRRTLERSTSSHNTVEVNSKNQSEVWAGFRVATRAKIIDLTENSNFIEATHDGYKKDNIFHTREWSFEENKIIIKDSLSKSADAVFRLHFHPSITKQEIINKIFVEDYDLEFINYNYSSEFNKEIKSIAVEVKFTNILKVEIHI